MANQNPRPETCAERSERIQNLEDVAIVIQPERDNVAVVTADFIEKGTPLQFTAATLVILGRMLRAQSFAIKPIRKGQAYITLGDPIGLASRSVAPGEPIDDTNLQDRLPAWPSVTATIARGRSRILNSPRSLLTATFAPTERWARATTWASSPRGCVPPPRRTRLPARAMREIYSRAEVPQR